MPVDPTFWGPHVWIILHSSAWMYPDSPDNSVKNIYKNFIESLSNLIPCGVCNTEFKKILKGEQFLKHGISAFGDDVLKSRDTLFKWIYDVHDFVNKNKKLMEGQTRTLSPKYEDVVSYYKKHIGDITKLPQLINSSLFWAPHFWYFIHIIASNYEEVPKNKDKYNILYFMRSMADLPSIYILYNKTMIVILEYGYLKRDKKDPLDRSFEPLNYNILESKKTFFRWTYDIHNCVNKYKGVSERPQYSLVVQFYNSKLTNSTPDIQI